MDNLLEHFENPGVIVFITGLMGAVTYLIQDWLKTGTTRREQKRKLYEDVLQNIFRLFFEDDPKEQSELVSKIEKCWLFASDDVLKACYSFLELIDSKTKGSNNICIGEILRKCDETKIEIEANIGQIFFHMRKDLRGRRTKIDEKWAKRKIKIYDWGALGNSKESQINPIDLA